MSNYSKTFSLSIAHPNKIISDNQRQIIGLVNYVILCGAISLFGTATNAINIVVFVKQGLNTTINISFFSLAISDLCSLILQQFLNLYVNPLFHLLDLPISHLELQYLTVAFPREMFARITCQITAFITVERCLCVVFPLHVKRIITPRVTSTLIISIYIFTLLSPLPIYCTSYYTWKFYPHLNKTLIGLVVTGNNGVAESVVYFTHALFTFLGFFCVLVFTLILIYKLRQKTAWRQTANADQETAKSMSKRDRATVTMVVLIAGILVGCYTPAVLTALAGFLIQEFSFRGRLANERAACWSIAILFENVNSSVNIFLYYKMSTKYRQTLQELFPKCLQNDVAAKETFTGLVGCLHLNPLK